MPDREITVEAPWRDLAIFATIALLFVLTLQLLWLTAPSRSRRHGR